MEGLEPTTRAWLPELLSGNIHNIACSVLDSDYSVPEALDKGNQASRASVWIGLRIECNEVAFTLLQDTHELVLAIPKCFEH